MKIIKRLLIVLITILMIINIPLYSRAFSFTSLIEDSNGFINAGNTSGGTITEAELIPISKSISNILLVIAIGVTIISLAAMAINFAIQSVEDKAKIKESMVPWIIGIFISFGAYGIWEITVNLFDGML